MHQDSRPVSAYLVRVTGGVFAISLLVLAMMLGGRIGVYIDIPSLIFVLGVTFGGVWFAHGPSAVFRAMHAALSGHAVDDATSRRHDAVLATAYGLAWASGVLSLFVGFIAMLADLSEPAAIGAGLAVALISPFYGLILAEVVFHPLRRALRTNSDDSPRVTGSIQRERGLGVSAAAALLLVILSMFVVLAIRSSDFEWLT